MDSEHLHQSFAKVVDASFDLTMAFNTHGSDSEEANNAQKQYNAAMDAYRQEMSHPFDTSIQLDNFCALHPYALECRVYDV